MKKRRAAPPKNRRSQGVGSRGSLRLRRRAATPERPTMKVPRVFVSYSQDSPEHKEQVLSLADRSRRWGVDCHLDQYVSSPSEGWPRWMSDQIDRADYVLIVCTKTYAQRAMGHERPGRGLGANWEGQLITQSIYDQGGRNTKFLPVTLGAGGASHIPRFLASSTRFDLSKGSGYETLYRLLTSQPAVSKPALGAIRKLKSLNASGGIRTSTVGEDATPLEEVKKAIVIWRLPRGFLLLDSLQEERLASWATLAHSYDYDGTWKSSTHYHESYRWSDKYQAIETQFRKLQVPRGDWNLASSAVLFLMEVRERKLIISVEGKITGSGAKSWIDGKFATVHPPGSVKLPRLPDEYRGLAVSGELRDLAAEAGDILTEMVSGDRPAEIGDLPLRVARLRREVRVELHRRLEPGHPAWKNLEEIISQYKPDDGLRRMAWLKEFTEATYEAIHCIEEQVE